MPTKTVSTIQAKAPLTRSSLLQISSGPCNIFDIEGNVDSTTGTSYYIQLLSTATPSTGLTIPLWSALCVQSSSVSGVNGFSFIYRPQGKDTSTFCNPFGGTVSTTGSNTLPVYIAISSTDTVWTSVAANTDVTVTYEETYLELPNQTIVGDLTTGVDSLAVWTANGPTHRLIQAVVSNSVASTVAPVYLMLFAYANPAVGALPLQQWQVTATSLQTLRFGDGVLFEQGNPTTYVANYNCYLYGSSTTQFFTATIGSNWTMQAFFI